MGLPTSQQDDIFVREFIATDDVLVSCMRAGIRIPGLSMSESARQTIERTDIQAAIAKAKKLAKYSRPIEFTNRSIAEDLEKVYDEAYAQQDWKACIMAKESQMRVLGLLVAKLEITKKKDVGETSTADLERWLRDHQRTIEGESNRVIDVTEAEEIEAEDKGSRGEAVQGDPRGR